MANKITDKTILNFVLWLMILKPIFDLDWRWPLFYIGSTPVPFHRIISFLVPAIITIVLFWRLFFNASVKINNNVFIIFFFLSIHIAFIFPENFYQIDEYIRTYSFIIIFLSVPFLISSKQKFYNVAKALISLSLIPTFLSYLQTFGLLEFSYYDYLPAIGKIGRISGGYLHPTGYLNYLLVLIPLIFYLYANRLISKRYFLFWLLFTLPMVGRSLHRATILLVLFDLTIFSVFFMRTWSKYIIIICYITLLSIFSSNIWRLVNVGGAITKGQFRGRSEIWASYMRYFQKSDIFHKMFGFGSSILPDGSFEPHSDWLRIMFNYGYLGITAYIIFLFSIFLIFSISLYKVKKGLKMQSEALTGLILVSTIVLYSVTMEPLRYGNFSWLFMLVIGYAYMTIVDPVRIRIISKFPSPS